MGISANVGGVVAIIRLRGDATDNVSDMSRGRIEVGVATRDDGGAKGVTVDIGRDK